MSVKDFPEKIRNLIPTSLRVQLQSLIHPKPVAAPELPAVRLACDLGKAKIALMEITKSGETVQLTKFCKFPRPKEEIDLIQALQTTFTEQGFQSNKIRISVKGHGVVVRFVQFPQMTNEELKGAITFEAEKYIPFKSDEVVLDHHIIDDKIETNSGIMMNVLIVAVKKDELYPLISVYKNAGFQVELIDIDSLAFMNALEFFYPEEFNHSVGILDVGSEISTLGIVKAGKPQFIRDISYGGLDLVKRLKRKLGWTMEQAVEALEVDRKPDEPVQKEIIDGLSPLIADLRVSLDYYLDQVHISDSLDKLFLSGGAGYHPIVSETLSKELGLTVSAIDILGKLQINPSIDAELLKKNTSLLPIVLGLCLREI